MLPALPVTRSTRLSIHWRMFSSSNFTGSAAQQVLDGHRAGLHGQAAADEFLETGQNLHLHLPLPGFIDQSPHLAPG